MYTVSTLNGIRSQQIKTFHCGNVDLLTTEGSCLFNNDIGQCKYLALSLMTHWYDFTGAPIETEGLSLLLDSLVFHM